MHHGMGIYPPLGRVTDLQMSHSHIHHDWQATQHVRVLLNYCCSADVDYLHKVLGHEISEAMIYILEAWKLYSLSLNTVMYATMQCLVGLASLLLHMEKLTYKWANHAPIMIDKQHNTYVWCLITADADHLHEVVGRSWKTSSIDIS